MRGDALGKVTVPPDVLRFRPESLSLFTLSSVPKEETYKFYVVA